MSDFLVSNIGFMPIISHYLVKTRFIENIDTLLPPLRSNHCRLSHGQTCFILILYLLTRPHVHYGVMDWVAETPYLKILIPDIEPNHLNDDRIADTYIALKRYGIQDLFASQSIRIIKEFNLSLKRVHCDFSPFIVHGDYKEKPDNDENDSILITYGYSKKSLSSKKKQFVQGVCVTSDAGVPVMTGTLDGNTTDVTEYLPLWKQVSNMMKPSDFIVIGDCKLTSHDNLLTIILHKGYFLAPLAKYSTLEDELFNHLNSKKYKLLTLVTKIEDNREVIQFSGFETYATLQDEITGKNYSYRKFFILSSQLRKDQLKSLQRSIDNALKDIQIIETRLNRFKNLDTADKIRASIKNILKKHSAVKVISFRIHETTSIKKVKKGKGRIGPNSVFIDKEVKHHSIEYWKDEEAIAKKKMLFGYFVLATNQPRKKLTMTTALKYYKQEWKVERIFERLKGDLQVIPIYLKKPEHIEALMFLLMTCVQLYTLIDRTAEKSLKAKNEKLAGLFPNNRTVSRPKAEKMLDTFRHASMVYHRNSGAPDVNVAILNNLQKEILDIIGVDNNYYTTHYVKARMNSNEITSYYNKNS